MDQNRHDFPPVQTMLVYQAATALAQHVAYLTEIIKPVAKRIEGSGGTVELTGPARIAIYPSDSKINDAVPRHIRPWAAFGIVLGMEQQNFHDGSGFPALLETVRQLRRSAKHNISLKTAHLN